MTQNGERSARMSPDELAQLHAALQEAPEIPVPEPTDYSMHQVIRAVYSALVTMKRRGYSVEDICEFIERRSGYAIKPNTLAKYMSQERQRRRRKGKRGRSRTSAARGASRLKRAKGDAIATSQAIGHSPTLTTQPAHKLTKPSPSTQPEPEASSTATHAEPEAPTSDAPAESGVQQTPDQAANSSSASQSFFQQLSKNAETFHRPRNPNALTSEPPTDPSN